MHCFLNPAFMTPTQHHIVIRWTRGVRRTRTQQHGRTQYRTWVFDFALVRGFGCSISHSREGREGKGRTYLSAGGASDEEQQDSKRGATPLSSPLGKKAAERARERGTSVRRVGRPMRSPQSHRAREAARAGPDQDQGCFCKYWDRS
jgi:hypothetical protein